MQKGTIISLRKSPRCWFSLSNHMLLLDIGDICSRVWNNDDSTGEILAQSDNPSKVSQFD